MENSSRRSFLARLSAFALITAAPAVPDLWAAPSDRLRADHLMFAGTYTDKGSTSLGIYAFRWDADAGTLQSLGLAAPTINPSFLALSPDRGHLYAVNEVDQYKNYPSGSVSSYRIEGASGKLKHLNVVPSGGTGPCNIATDFTGRAVFVANYDSGSAASYRVQGKGQLSKPVSRFQYSGKGADAQRQTGPHAHCTTVSPDNRWVLVNDLGLDRIAVYRLDPVTALLTPNEPAFYEALPGSGPRNFTFHPSGRWAYSLNEIANTVDALAWDSEKGVLTRLQNISTLPEGFQGMNTGATVQVDAEGRFLYVSNRGNDSIAVFRIDSQQGTLSTVQHMDCGGKGPRHFALDPGNEWLLVANQQTSNIVVFARNGRSGLLQATGRQYPLGAPVCLAFV